MASGMSDEHGADDNTEYIALMDAIAQARSAGSLPHYLNVATLVFHELKAARRVSESQPGFASWVQRVD